MSVTGTKTPEQNPSDRTGEHAPRHFVARQPVFDEHHEVFGYEIVSHSRLPPGLSFAENDNQCSRVIADGALLMDWDVLTAGKLGLVRITRDVLMEGQVRLLPQETVIQISAVIDVDRKLLSACEELRRDGYGIALDFGALGFVRHPLLTVASVVVVDPRLNRESHTLNMTRWRDETGAYLLASGVETRQAFEQARSLGFGLFQGFYFARPTVVSARDVPASKVQLLSILREVYRSEMDYESVEKAIRQDPGLCYKLLRYINAASHGLKHEITTIRRAIVQLGESELRRWVSLCVLAMTAADRPSELILLGLARARFSEQLAPLVGLGQRSDDLFLLGVLSVFDAVLGRPIDETLAPLPIQQDIKRALIDGEGPLNDVFELIRYFERGQWSRVKDAIREDRHREVALHYLEALQWAAELAEAS